MKASIGLMLFLVFALPSAQADTQFRARKMSRSDVPSAKGQCDVWIFVDGEVQVSVRSDLVFVHTISGREPRDAGSECNQPLPTRDIRGFRFEEADSRAEMQLLSEPTRRNDYRAVVRIRDSQGGECRCHFRLTWEIADNRDFSKRGSDDFPERRPGEDLEDPRGGLAWNNTTHFGGRGVGSSTLAGYDTQRLLDASIDIDRGNRIFVSFRTGSGRKVSFSGAVMAADRETIKADVATEDGVRLRGPMYLSRNARGEVDHITLEATNGQDRLTLRWDRR